MHDPHRIDSLEALRTLYRQPSALTANKERPVLDDASRVFVERCRFASVATFDEHGNADVSPRGGPSGGDVGGSSSSNNPPTASTESLQGSVSRKISLAVKYEEPPPPKKRK